MSLKLFVLAALVAVASAGYLGSQVAYQTPIAYRAPVAVYAKAAPAKVAVNEDDEVDPNPSYSFSYDVSDAETGDTKTQSQSLENGVVKGSYSVVDPDGVRRTVEYTADDVNGFNAVVNTEASGITIPVPKAKVVKAAAPQPAKLAAVYHAPLAYHAPAVAYHAAPVAKVYSAPVAAKVISSPHSYSTSHFSYQPSVRVAAAPVYKKLVYA